MNRTVSLFSILLAGLVLSLPPFVLPACAQATTAPAGDPDAPAPATADEELAARAAALRGGGIDLALKGDFTGGLALLDQAAALAPDDPTASRAKDLLTDYMQHRERADAQRAEEHATAVRRVRRCMLSEQAAAGLKQDGIAEPLRDKVKLAVRAYNQTSAKVGAVQGQLKEASDLRAHSAADLERIVELQTALEKARAEATDPPDPRIAELQSQIDALQKASDEKLDRANEVSAKAAGAKAESLSLLDSAVTGLTEADGLLQGRDDEYAHEFLRTSAEARRRLGEFKDAWSADDPTGEAAMEHRAYELSLREDDLVESLADVDSMIDKAPWALALAHARLARDLAGEGQDVPAQPWYRAMVEDVERRGVKAVEEARWYDAMEAYVGLEQLEEDNADYEQKAKDVRRHVRVLGLYGRRIRTGDPAMPEIRITPEGEEEAPAPDETQPADDDGWRKIVSGVDDEMVKEAISKLDAYYVTPVDYRDLTRAALRSIRILAETPQAADSFPLLADPEKKDPFVEAIDSQLENLRQRDRVDNFDLILALNAVTRASERTVEIPTSVLAVEFTDGLLGELDKFSAMIWPSEVTDFRKNTMGQFHGVGVQITKQEGEALEVVTPLADSPALKAGVRAGDMIVAVDGTPTQALSINKLISMIMGEKGTKVTLTIERPGRPTAMDIEVIRDEISIQTVKGWKRVRGGKWQFLIDPEAGVAYMGLSQFTDTTSAEVEAALSQIQEELRHNGREELRSLIVDLRFNPGGLLHSATDVADEFLTRGRIVETRGRRDTSKDVRADEGGMYLTGNLIVLVNEQSASAAEILSGALKDWQRGLILGGRTYGKGSVQNVIPIRHQRAFLKLTTAHYYLPSGRLLHRTNGMKDWGVDPDVAVPATPRQTRRWLELRRKTGLLLMDQTPAWLEDDLKRQYEEDIQLQTAVLLLKLMELKTAPAAA